MNRFRRTPAVRTGSARTDRIHIELVVNAVLPRVGSFVDVPVVANLAPQRLHALLMAIGSCADEIVVGQAESLPAGTERLRHFVGKLLRSLTGSLRGAFNFLPVLVGSSQEPGIVTQHAMPARDRIAGDRSEAVPNMRTRVDVINRGRDVERLAH